MYFESVAEAIYMDGHGVYVWVAYAIATALLLWLVWAPSRQLRQRKAWIIADGQRRASVDALASAHQDDDVVSVNPDQMETDR